MSDEQWMNDPEVIEALFHKAVEAGDTQGVEACLRRLVVIDPHRAGDLYDTLKLAVDLVRHDRGSGKAE